MDFYFDDYNRQSLHRRTPYNQGRRRQQISLDDSWQETAMRLELPTYSRVLSNESSEESNNTVMDLDKPMMPIHFDPKNTKKAAKGMNFYPDDVQLSEADLPRPPLDYEQFDSSLHVDDSSSNNNNGIGNSDRGGDAIPPAAPPPSPRGEQQRSSSRRASTMQQQPFQPSYPLEQQPQQLYTGMMRAPLSLIAKQVYPNTPSPLPASIAAIASPVWSGDRTGDTLKKAGHHGQLISTTKTAVNVREKEGARAAAEQPSQHHGQLISKTKTSVNVQEKEGARAAAAKPSPQQQQQRARLHMVWSGNQTDGASGNTGTIGWNTELIELANNNKKERKEQQRVELLGCLDTVLMNGQILWSRQQQQKSTSSEGGKKKKN